MDEGQHRQRSMKESEFSNVDCECEYIEDGWFTGGWRTPGMGWPEKSLIGSNMFMGDPSLGKVSRFEPLWASIFSSVK